MGDKEPSKAGSARQSLSKTISSNDPVGREKLGSQSQKRKCGTIQVDMMALAVSEDGTPQGGQNDLKTPDPDKSKVEPGKSGMPVNLDLNPSLVAASVTNSSKESFTCQKLDTQSQKRKCGTVQVDIMALAVSEDGTPQGGQNDLKTPDQDKIKADSDKSGMFASLEPTPSPESVTKTFSSKDPVDRVKLGSHSEKRKCGTVEVDMMALAVSKDGTPLGGQNDLKTPDADKRKVEQVKPGLVARPEPIPFHELVSKTSSSNDPVGREKLGSHSEKRKCGTVQVAMKPLAVSEDGTPLGVQNDLKTPDQDKSKVEPGKSGMVANPDTIPSTESVPKTFLSNDPVDRVKLGSHSEKRKCGTVEVDMMALAVSKDGTPLGGQNDLKTPVPDKSKVDSDKYGVVASLEPTPSPESASKTSLPKDSVSCSSLDSQGENQRLGAIHGDRGSLAVSKESTGVKMQKESLNVNQAEVKEDSAKTVTETGLDNQPRKDSSSQAITEKDPVGRVILDSQSEKRKCGNVQVPMSSLAVSGERTGGDRKKASNDPDQSKVKEDSSSPRPGNGSNQNPYQQSPNTTSNPQSLVEQKEFDSQSEKRKCGTVQVDMISLAVGPVSINGSDWYPKQDSEDLNQDMELPETQAKGLGDIWKSPILLSLCLLVLSVFVLFVANQLLSFVQVVEAAPFPFRVLGWCAFGLLVIALVFSVFKLWLNFRKLSISPGILIPKVSKFQSEGRPLYLTKNEKKQVEALQEIVKTYPMDKIQEKMLEKYKLKFQDFKSNVQYLFRNDVDFDRDWVEECSRKFVEPLEQCAKKLVSKYAFGVAIKNGLVNKGIMETLILAINAVIMFEELCRIFNVRTNKMNSIYMISNLFLAIMLVDKTSSVIDQEVDKNYDESQLEADEDFTTEASSFALKGIGDGIAKFGLKGASNGLINYLFMKRLGNLAISKLKPISYK